MIYDELANIKVIQMNVSIDEPPFQLRVSKAACQTNTVVDD